MLICAPFHLLFCASLLHRDICSVTFFSLYPRNHDRWTTSYYIHIILIIRQSIALLQNRPLFQVIYPGYLWARDKRWLLSRVQRLAGPVGGTGAFCPGWSHQPGQKAPLLSRLVAPPGTKGPTPFIPVDNTNPDKRVTLLSRLVLPTRTKGPST